MAETTESMIFKMSQGNTSSRPQRAGGPGINAGGTIHCDEAMAQGTAASTSSGGRKGPGSALANPGYRSISQCDGRARTARLTSSFETSRAHGGQVGRSDPASSQRESGEGDPTGSASGLLVRDSNVGDNGKLDCSNHRGPPLCICDTGRRPETCPAMWLLDCQAEVGTHTGVPATSCFGEPAFPNRCHLIIEPGECQEVSAEFAKVGFRTPPQPLPIWGCRGAPPRGLTSSTDGDGVG